tara:strand:+ start:472 stop:837 length:366 start_codon:yes stop_codon:yes gene_type:complete
LEVTKLNEKIHGLLKIAMQSPQHYRNVLMNRKHICERELKRRLEENLDWDAVQFELEFVKNELEIIEIEQAEDVIYLPSGDERTIYSITDIIYYEALYGKTIYKRPKGVGKEIKERETKNI